MRNDEPCFAFDNLVFLEKAFEAYCRDSSSVEAGLGRYFDRLTQDNRPTSMARPAADRPVPQNTAESIENISSDDCIKLLKQCPLFSTLSDQNLHQVAALTTQIYVESGQPICLEGEAGDELYLIISGSVVVRSGGRVLAERGVDDVVGELAVLDNQPRSADVIARNPVTLLRIQADDFNELLRRRSELSRQLLRVLASRVRGHSGRQANVDQLVRAYRERGHTIANLDPLGLLSRSDPTLTLEFHDLNEQDLESVFSVRLGEGRSLQTLRQIRRSLQNTYCREIGVQYTHINDLEIQNWLRIRMEETENRRPLSAGEQRRILAKLTSAEVFESFLHRKFSGAKRFSLEGAESLIPLLDQAIEEAHHHGIEDVVIGMAHRGRLNVLANILDKPASRIFHEFEDVPDASGRGRGDVKYHLGHSCDRITEDGHKVHLSLSFNPSHLEFIDPVVLGRTRAKQDRLHDSNGSRAMAILIHGNAAFAGQGVVQEVLNMSELSGYRTGGTLHIIVNNQIAFTSEPDQGRSSQYVTDVARMLQIPIFHVNGEHPEAVHQVIHLAMEFRSRYKKDVVIDMYCYRRYGHNEGDDPAFTQPLLYQAIGRQSSVRTVYVENLLRLDGINQREADDIGEQSLQRLEIDLTEARSADFQVTEVPAGQGVWHSVEQAQPSAQTTVSLDSLRRLMRAITRVPENFQVNPRLLKLLKQRESMALGEHQLDWGAAEALAFASLVDTGCRVRITGQDCERGTFAHRHAIWHDTHSNERYCPFQNVSAGQASFDIHNSPLSEIGVLGFEYGYSLDYPDALVIWEAQFGDFSNVAQVIIDQFIVSAEQKWGRYSGLCLLLPHGFDGQGPEHSSARLERFLTLAADDNIRVVNPTTPAQIYHALRRQLLEPVRKPLVIMAPKALLRNRSATSSLQDLADGKFQTVIADHDITQPERVRRILLCAGKLYYELAAGLKNCNDKNIAILRLEQYYPFPESALLEALADYPASAQLCWVQEEPRNMGAWSYLHTHVADRLQRGGRPLDVCISRAESASGATGSLTTHKLQQRSIIERALSSSIAEPGRLSMGSE